ncbi:hypothetical protein [Clostridium tertium]|uniref:hypothetical protein n=1 Tax=Clostridium tertium TaxID=1559 RepID=UPI001C1E3AAB|nr:hypothetical protein [Clostridium tertium]MBU6134021.1 hypothetical protein [Clostridium tertium]
MKKFGLLIFYIVIILIAIFSSKLFGKLVAKRLKKSWINKNYKSINEIIDNLIESSNLDKEFEHYANPRIKVFVYLFIAIASFIQLIFAIFLSSNDVPDLIVCNSSLLTMLISLLEFRDIIFSLKETNIRINEKLEPIIAKIKEHENQEIENQEIENKSKELIRELKAEFENEKHIEKYIQTDIDINSDKNKK